MAGVYSREFAAQLVQSGSITRLFVVPDGHVYAIRNISLTVNSGGSSGYVAVSRRIGTDYVTLLAAPNLGNHETLASQGYWVVEAGAGIWSDSQGAQYAVHISGFDLSAIPG